MNYDFHAPVSNQELKNRLNSLKKELAKRDPDWSMVLIHNPINLYYLTGSVCDGVLTVTKNECILWVRKNFDRSKSESEFEDIRPMKSFRILAEYFSNVPNTVYIEYKYATIQWLNLLKKYFSFESSKDITPILNYIRSYKSNYELECMKHSGKIQALCLEQILPKYLHEGISEAELCGQMLFELIRHGSMGTCRFENPHGEPVGGICAFSENALYGIAFDSPDGCKGTYIPVQAIGSHNRNLRKGDLIFADISCGVAGYHTDKSVVYFYGKLSEHRHGNLIKRAYDLCIEIEKKAASMLKPNTTPEDIYNAAYSMVPYEFHSKFMFGKKFIGHSIGLTMDESPAIAPSFDTPIIENQVFAIEPKIALDDIGIVGSENTYIVSQNGGICITGNPLPLIEIC